MSQLIIALLFPLLAVAEATFLGRSLPGGVTPSLCLWLILACGLRGGAAAGSAAGLWGGTLIAALRGDPAAPLALLYGLAGWLAGVHGKSRARRLSDLWVGCALVVLMALGEIHLTGATAPPWTALMQSLGWNCALCLALVGVRRIW